MAAIAKPLLPSQNALPVCLQRRNLNRLASLWDIVNRFNLFEMTALVSQLANIEATHGIVLKQNPDGDIVPPPEYVAEVYQLFVKVQTFCASVGFDDCKYVAGMRVSDIARAPESFKLSRLEETIHFVIEALFKESTKQAFLRVPHEYIDYIDKADLFGPKVYDGFPSARTDIRAAGNCLASDCNTAAVFHSMRVAEWGLRALARDRRVNVPKGPIDLATWEDIIRELEKTELAIQGYPKTLAREAQYEFVHGAMMEFKRFKNIFRNPVMHTRDSYDGPEAYSVFNHVRAFMTILAERISEKKRTPLVWKRV